jgi:imidazolonepropionase-like amidohydrolase
MRWNLALPGLLIGAAACSSPTPSNQAPTPSTANVPILFEGARLIVGDTSDPIENAAFLVDGGKIVRVGRRGELQAPAGATRVDLTGKTVMPALVGTHVHVGLLHGARFGPEHYTRERIVEHLQRYAYYGVGAVLSAGTDVGPLTFEIRRAPPPNAARLLTAGRGMAAPDAGPGFPSIAGTSFPVTSAAEGRQRVQELAAEGANAVKIWVDDRNGRVKKLSADIFGPIIDEAHKHGMMALAHVYYLKDAHELVDAGIDGFMHLVRDAVMDDGLIAKMKARNVFAAANIGGTHRATLSEAPAEAVELLSETVPSSVVEAFRSSFASRDPRALAASRATYAKMEQSVARLKAAGVTIVLGGDTGIPNAWHGWAEHYELERMVAAGMSPAEVIVASTSAAARILKLDDMGTVAAGKRADYLVLDANPLENITNTRRISAVYLEGRPLDRAALRTKWTSVQAANSGTKALPESSHWLLR